MKPVLFAPPALALIVSSFWIGGLQSKLASAQKEIADLHRSNRPSASISGNDSSRSNRPTAASDWQSIAARNSILDYGFSGTRERTRLIRQINQMSADELFAGYDECQTLDENSTERKFLENTILMALTEKAPERMLERFFSEDLERPSNKLNFLAEALSNLADRDLTTAGNWLDQQIAAGAFDRPTLDGTNSNRSLLESALLSKIIRTDPQAAAARLENIPEQQRTATFWSMSSDIPDAAKLNFVELARQFLPALESVSADPGQRLKNSSTDVVTRMMPGSPSAGGYDEASAYLDQISASPIEREAAVQAMGQARLVALATKQSISATELDAFRCWAATQSPESVDRDTGRTLASLAVSTMKYEDAGKLALHYQNTTGSDEILVNFLSQSASSNHPEQASALAEKISDPQKRNEVLRLINRH
ncbi:hypothetical protein JIN85_13850 [Luteolibacter pohnpeiensis]|uniref:Uncharacterized protein n=1 Tax=Luteolibacter pohnpeiensis TaxID=454153 RepID=A0A934VRR8_9BACT|nr:hypothetical protein [Luteolibacter pohnpeiensis]MBK1883506.1 hypothetical protein [Luteolibacter pohnpeiensis]